MAFAPTTDGYENMSFWQFTTFEMEVGGEAVQALLPATAVLRLYASGASSLSITHDGNGNLYTHEYQINDDQYDPLALVICDQ